MGHDAQFDLRIVGRDDHVFPVRRRERPAYFTTRGIAYRYVLKVRVGGTQPSGSRHGLVERSVDPPRVRIDELGQSLYVGREQLFQPPVFQYFADHRMVVGQRLQVLFVGAVLSRFGLFRLRVYLQLFEQHFAQLFGRIDVQFRRFGHFAYPGFQPGGFDGQRRARFSQYLPVHENAGELHPRQYRNQRRFDPAVQPGLLRLLQQRPEFPVKPQGHVRILGGVFRHRRRIGVGHGGLPGPFADQRFDRHRLVVQETFGQKVHPVPGFRIEQVVNDHRVVQRSPHFDAGRVHQHQQVEFDVLPDFPDASVLKNGSQGLQYGGAAFGRRRRHPPGFVRFHGERKPHEFRPEGVDARRFGIETEFFGPFEFRDQRGQFETVR